MIRRTSKLIVHVLFVLILFAGVSLVAADLSGPPGPMAPVLARLDPALSTPIVLTKSQFEQLLAFVRDGLLDPRATPEHLRHLVPHTVPSGRPVLQFEFP